MWYKALIAFMLNSGGFLSAADQRVRCHKNEIMRRRKSNIIQLLGRQIIAGYEIYKMYGYVHIYWDIDMIKQSWCALSADFQL